MKARDHARLHLEPLEERATPALVASTFDTDGEGWTTLRGDGNGPGANARQWRSPGGNPGGYVQATDRQDNQNWFWRAPDKFRGNLLAAAGTYLTFDLRQTATDQQGTGADVRIVGGPAGGRISLDVDFRKNPNTGWTPYAVKLSESGGWKIAGRNTAPTAAQFLTVLSNVTDLFIRGEYSSRTSVGSLDNVVVGADAPKLVISSVSRFEGRSGLTPFQFNVSLSHFTAAPVAVRYSTSNQTALAGSDYNAVNNAELRLNVGERHKAFTIFVRGDRSREAAETFAVTLSSATNATIGQAVGIGTILNDD